MVLRGDTHQTAFDVRECEFYDSSERFKADSEIPGNVTLIPPCQLTLDFLIDFSWVICMQKSLELLDVLAFFLLTSIC